MDFIVPDQQAPDDSLWCLEKNVRKRGRYVDLGCGAVSYSVSNGAYIMVCSGNCLLLSLVFQ